MSEEFGPWIEHDGSGPPVSGGTYVRVLDREGKIWEGFTSGISPESGEVDVWDWRHCMSCGYPQWAITKYQIRKPRGLTILEGLLEELPEGVDA